MERVILIADSGSTKTDWLLRVGERNKARIATQGINPFMLSEEEIESILRNELLTNEEFICPTEIRFYGAGCRGAQCDVVASALRKAMPTAENVKVDSDLAGAAHALYGKADGIACILGTGSNSGLFVDGKIVENVSPLGFILGDEGSGAVLGRRLVGDVLKKQLPEHLCRAFEEAYHLTGDEIIRRTYKEPFPNRFLASFAPFLHAHRKDEAIAALLHEEFSRFFRRNVAAYQRPDLPVGFVGSVAWYFREEVAKAATDTGFKMGRIKRCPLD